MKKLLSIFTLGLTAMLLLGMIPYTVYANPGPTIYMDKSHYYYDTNSGVTYFNVTILVSNPSAFTMSMFQIWLIYDESMINVTEFYGGTTMQQSFRAWPNDNLDGRTFNTSYVFYNAAGGAIGNPAYYAGGATAALQWGDLVAGDKNVPASTPKILGIVEFAITAVPAEYSSLNCTLNINNDNTFLFNSGGMLPDVTKVDSDYGLTWAGPRIYMDQSHYYFDTNSKSIGDKFNVTILVDQSGAFNMNMFQIWLEYNHNYVNVTQFWSDDLTMWIVRAWPGPSELGGSDFDTNFVFYHKVGYLGPARYFWEDANTGAVEWGFLVSENQSIVGPKILGILEFVIVAVPAEYSSLNCTLSINNDDTYLHNSQGPIPDVTKVDSDYGLTWAGPTICMDKSHYYYDTSTMVPHFNVTVYVSHPTAFVMALWQICLTYDESMINVTRFWGGITGDWSYRAWPNDNLGGRTFDANYVFYNVASGWVGNPIYHSGGVSAAVQWGDLVAGDKNVPANTPKILGICEFAVTAVPAEHGQLNCTLGIDNDDTFLFNTAGPIPDVTKVDSDYGLTWAEPIHDVTIQAHCRAEVTDVSVSIIMDGSPTGYTTPHTFTGLIGTHTFTVPDTDSKGHSFEQWSTGELTTTITVTSEGAYTAYYQDAWSMFHHDLNHTGYSTSIAPNTNNTFWSYSPSSSWERWPSPAVAYGRVYMSHSDTLCCLNASNGAFIWEFGTGYDIASCPAVAGGKVYVASGDGTFCLNALSGSLIWWSNTGDSLFSSPAVADGKVYVGSAERELWCLNASTGTVVWSYETYNYVFSSPAVADGKVYVGSYDNRVCCLNASTGAHLWTHWTGGAVVSAPAISDGKVYVGSEDHNVYCFNASDGAGIWSYTTGYSIDSSPAVADGKVYVGSWDCNVYCLNASTGAHLWSYTTNGYVDSSPAVAAGKVYVGSWDCNVYCLNASTGALKWSYATGDYVLSSPAIADGKVYVESTRLYAFALYDVAVSNVVSSKTVVGQGYTCKINVTVVNEGDIPETFNITVYANTTQIWNQTITNLSSQTSNLLSFTWNTSGFALGNYTIRVEADVVPDETHTADNIALSGVVHVGIPGNVNYDERSRIVDMIDMWLVQKYYGAVKGQPSPLYVPNYDIDDNGKINMLDLWITYKHFGQTEP